VPKSAAVFSGDMLQTRLDSTATIQSNGSSVMVLADSLVKLEGPAVELEHGAVRVTTSRGLTARDGEAGERFVDRFSGDRRGWTRADRTPRATSRSRTRRERRQRNAGTGGHEDDTADTEKKKKKHRKSAGAAPAAAGGIMSSPAVVYGGLAGVGAGVIWIWPRNEKSSESASVESRPVILCE
jgi:hypothetical protein